MKTSCPRPNNALSTIEHSSFLDRCLRSTCQWCLWWLRTRSLFSCWRRRLALLWSTPKAKLFEGKFKSREIYDHNQRERCKQQWRRKKFSCVTKLFNPSPCMLSHIFPLHSGQQETEKWERKERKTWTLAQHVKRQHNSVVNSSSIKNYFALQWLLPFSIFSFFQPT